MRTRELGYQRPARYLWTTETANVVGLHKRPIRAAYTRVAGTDAKSCCTIYGLNRACEMYGVERRVLIGSGGQAECTTVGGFVGRGIKWERKQ